MTADSRYTAHCQRTCRVGDVCQQLPAASQVDEATGCIIRYVTWAGRIFKLIRTPMYVCNRPVPSYDLLCKQVDLRGLASRLGYQRPALTRPAQAFTTLTEFQDVV